MTMEATKLAVLLLRLNSALRVHTALALFAALGLVPQPAAAVDNLPTGYEPLLYIDSDDTAHTWKTQGGTTAGPYIVLTNPDGSAFVPEATDTIELKYAFDAVIGASEKSSCWLFCSRQGGNGKFGFLRTSDQGSGFRYDYADKSMSISSPANYNNTSVRTVTANSDGIYFDGSLTPAVQVSGAASYIKAKVPMYLFAAHPEETADATTTSVQFEAKYGTAKMYYFRVKKSDGEYRMNLVPAKDSDGKVGMYDLVSDQFFTSASEVAFSGSEYGKWYMKGEDAVNTSSFAKSSSATIGWASTLNGTVDKDHTVSSVNDYFVPSEAVLRTSNDDATENKFNGHSLTIDGGGFSLKSQSGDITSGATAPNHYKTITVANLVLKNNGKIAHATDGVEYTLAGGTVEIPAGETGVFSVSGKNVRHLKVQSKLVGGGILNIEWSGNDTGPATNNHKIEFDGDCSEFTGTITAEEALADDNRILTLVFDKPFGGTITSLPKAKTNAIKVNYDENNQGLTVDDAATVIPAALREDLVFYGTTTDFTNTENLPLVTFPKTAVSPASASDLHDAVRDGTYSVTIKYAASDDGTATQFSQGNMGVIDNFDDTYTLVASYAQTSIAGATVTYSLASATYNGSKQEPTVTVTLDSVDITDFCDVSWGSQGLKDAGSYTPTITAKAGSRYTGSVTPQNKFTIAPKTVTLSWSNVNLTYNGQPQHPTCTAGDLVSGDTCNVTLTAESSKTNAGNDYMAEAKSLDNSNYQLPTADKQKGYSITQKSLSGNVKFSSIAAQTYSGSAITPTFIVTDNARSAQLTKDTDYTVEYSDNFNAGTATITITGMGNYKDTATTTFTINAKSLTSSMVTLSKTEAKKDGQGWNVLPTVTVKDGVTTLTENTHYTKTWSPSEVTGAGVYTCTVTGNGNYSGTATKTYTVTAPEDPDAVPLPRLVRSRFVYDGTPKTVAFVSTVGFTPSGTTSGTDVGEYEITCTLDSDKHWEDGSTDLIVVKWWIVEKDNRPFLERLADDPRKVDTSPYATGGDIILQEGNEYIHVFTNTVTAGTFSLTADKKARVLTVGGGGSGGSTYEGQSGGGGAGGVKYDPAYPLSADRTYEIHVGKAGVWTTYDVDPNSPGYSNVQEYQKAFPTGVNGGESYLICDGQNHILPAGGGGYGQQFYWGSITVNSGSSVGNGVNGGAGGGCGYGGFISGGTGGHRGSNKTGTNIMSGSQSGGGGGAARDGTDLNESTGAIWGQGGDGINCDILGFHQVFGGGGAGFSSISDVPGGIGGGGSWDGELRMPILAENGLGGGGPGGNRDSGVQLNGGSGLVVIRYSAASTPIVKTILVPEAIEGLAYTGWAQTGVPDGFGYTLSGKSRETNAGDYVAIATLAEGYVWSDGTKDPIEIHWSIAPADLGSARGVLIGAPAQMAMGAIVKPTFKFMFNGKEVPAAKYQITDWSGELMNLGTYTAIATPTAAGTNLTGAREVTFTINNSVATYYHVGENGGGYSSFETSQDAGIGWSTELGGVVDANHKVFANCDYVLPTGTTLRTVEKDANQTFNGNSLELRGGTLALKRIGSSNGVWYAPNQIYTFNRLIANGGGISAYTDAHLEVDATELIFAEGGLAILVSGSNSRQITLKTTVRNYTKGDLVINPNGGGTGANQAKGVTLLGDWSEFTGDIITKTMDTKCQDFHLCVPVAFNGRVRSLPPPAMINSNKEQDRYTAVIFDYDKFRDQTRGLLIGTNDVNAVALLKNRLYLITTKSSKTPNLPVMTFPAGTEVTASEFTGVRVISSYTANTQPATGTVLTGMGTRMNEDGTITLYANFSNDIAKFDVTCPPQVYTGSELTPVVTVKLAGRTLVEGTDYTIGTWSGGLTAVGDHLATITGLGDYEDTTNVTFTILSATAIDLSQNYTFDPVDVPYDGKPHTVAVELTDAAKGATVKYSETEDGPYTLDQAPSPVLPYNATIYCEISREGSTTVYRSAQLTIRAWVNAWNEASNVAPKITPTSWAAGGSAGTVTDATAKYGVVKSYLQLHGTSVSNLWSRAMPDVPGNYVIYYIPEELPYVTNENMGVRKIEFTITGGLSGSITAPSQTYTGSPLTPAYTVTYTVPSKGVSRTLIKDIDFTEGSWSPAGLTDADDYQMTLSGIPPYTGSITVNFKINQAQNEWTQLPAISPTEWTTTESYGALTPGKTKFGSVTATYTQNGVEMGPFPGLAALAAAKKKGEFVVTYTAPTTDANVLQPTELTQSVTFTITQGEYTYGKYETLSAAGGAYTVVTNAAFGADDEIDNMPVEVTAYANRDADLLMFHDGTAPVAATFNHFRIIGTDGQLQHNLVPARRDDGTDGFYDTVSKQFFANSNEVQGATLTVENNVTAEVAVPELAATTIRETGAEIDILARNGVSAQGMLVHGTAKATGPGTYTFTLTPDDAHVWAGGTFATRTYAWTITEDTRTEVKKPYAITPAPQWNGGSTVNGVGYDSTLLNELYSIGGDGISKSEVGEYVSTAKLLNPEQDRWEGTHESELTINWSIVQAVNEWTTELELSKRGWEPGEAVSLTTPVAKFGTVQGWLKRPGSAAFEAWTPDIRSLSVNGDYQLKFTVEGTTQYSSLEVIQDFRIKDGTMKDDIVAENVEAVYDGQPHGITVMCEGSATNATVRFMDSSGGYTLTESPTQTDVGVLTVWYQVSKTGKVTVTDSRTVTVIKRTPVVSGTAALAGWTEGDEGEHIPSGCAVTPAECGPVVYGYYADAACTRRFAGQPVAAGTYYVRGEVAEGETWFAAASMPATAFTIASADPDGVPLPKVSPATYEHTGSTITPVFEATAGYTTDGDTSATAVGTYTITCTLEPGKHWVGGATGPYDLQWEIVAAETFLQKLARDPRRVNGALVTNYDTGYAVGGDLVLFDSETSEYIHVFTNTASTATFTPSANLNARVLLVGGGGSGGCEVGGGGGAGGMIEANSVAFPASGTYCVAVGKGGEAQTTKGMVGNNGGNSSISNATEALMPVAIGGGGGGCYPGREPLNGGSGGGECFNEDKIGRGTEGQGNDGGSGWYVSGIYNYWAGGGGGAGSIGQKAVDGKAGDGGSGLASDILGFSQFFAGGGGGGTSKVGDNCYGHGGQGGGGDGCEGHPTSMRAEAGENGLGGGSGGGGGGADSGQYPSAAGGDGIVIIRYAAPNAREVAPVPESWLTVRKLFTNGKTQVGVESASRGSTLSGDYYCDAAGTYTAVATLAPGYTRWEDGVTTSSRSITWQMLDGSTWYLVVTDDPAADNYGQSSYSKDMVHWNRDPDAAAGVSHKASAGYHYVVPAGKTIALIKDDGAFAGESLTLAGTMALRDPAKEKTVKSFVGQGGLIRAIDRHETYALNGDSLSVAEDQSLAFRLVGTSVYNLKFSRIEGAGKILLEADEEGSATGLKLSGNASGFTGKIAMAPGSTVEPQNFTLTIANAFGGTIESLPSAANVTEVRFNSGANVGGLVVSSTAIPEALKTKLVVYDYDVAASDKPLVTFPAGTAVNAAEFTIKSAVSVGAEGTAFKSVRKVTNSDGTISLYPNIEYTLSFEGLEGASNPNEGKTFTVDDELILIAPGKRDGYVFGGWQEDDTPISYIPKNTMGNKTLTATWVSTNAYQLIEYIATTNCQFLDTGVTPRNAHFGFALDFWNQCYGNGNCAKVIGSSRNDSGGYPGFYLGNWRNESQVVEDHALEGQFNLCHQINYKDEYDFNPMMCGTTRVRMMMMNAPDKERTEVVAYAKYTLEALDGAGVVTSALHTAWHSFWTGGRDPYTDMPEWFPGSVYVGGVNLGPHNQGPKVIGYAEDNFMRFYRVTFYYDDIVLYDAIPAIDGNGHVGLLRVDGTEGELFAYSKTIDESWLAQTGNPRGAEFVAPHFIVNGNGGEPEETAVVKVLDEAAQPALTLPVRAGHVLMGFTENQDGTGTLYFGADGSLVVAPPDGATIYAQWMLPDIDQATVILSPSAVTLSNWQDYANVRVTVIVDGGIVANKMTFSELAAIGIDAAWGQTPTATVGTYPLNLTGTGGVQGSASANFRVNPDAPSAVDGAALWFDAADGTKLTSEFENGTNLVKRWDKTAGETVNYMAPLPKLVLPIEGNRKFELVRRGTSPIMSVLPNGNTYLDFGGVYNCTKAGNADKGYGATMGWWNSPEDEAVTNCAAMQLVDVFMVVADNRESGGQFQHFLSSPWDSTASSKWTRFKGAGMIVFDPAIDYSEAAQCLLDGSGSVDGIPVIPKSTYYPDGFHVLRLTTDGTGLDASALCSYKGDAQGGLKYGEIIAFESIQSDAAAEEVIDYLYTKWITPKQDNILIRFNNDPEPGLHMTNVYMVVAKSEPLPPIRVSYMNLNVTSETTRTDREFVGYYDENGVKYFGKDGKAVAGKEICTFAEDTTLYAWYGLKDFDEVILSPNPVRESDSVAPRVTVKRNGEALAENVPLESLSELWLKPSWSPAFDPTAEVYTEGTYSLTLTGDDAHYKEGVSASTDFVVLEGVYDLSAIRPDGPVVSGVMGSWLKAAFSDDGKAKTKDAYQGDFFKTNASGVVAWQAYVLGFTGAEVKAGTAKIVEETVQNASPDTVTIRLKDLPEESVRPETGCTVKYSLCAARTTAELLTNGGTVVKDLAGNPFERCEKSTFEAPLSDLSDENPVNYYRIKVHFIFDGGGSGGGGDAVELYSLESGQTVRVGEYPDDNWSLSASGGSVSLNSLTIPVEQSDAGYLRVTYTVKSQQDASYVYVNFCQAGTHDLINRGPGYITQDCDGFNDTNGGTDTHTCVYRIPPTDAFGSLDVRWQKSDGLEISDVKVESVDYLEAAKTSDEIFAATVDSEALATAKANYLDAGNAQWTRNLQNLRKALNGEAPYDARPYNMLILGDSLSGDMVYGCVEALIKRQFPDSNLRMYVVKEDNTGCVQFMTEDTDGNKALKQLDFANYDGVVYAGTSQARNTYVNKDTETCNAVERLTDYIRDSSRNPTCEIIMLSPMLSVDSRMFKTYGEWDPTSDSAPQHHYWDTAQVYVGQVGSACAKVENWDVAKDSWAAVDYAAMPSIGTTCANKNMAYWDLYKVAYDYLFRSGKTYAFYSRDAQHANAVGQTLTAHLVFEAFKIVGGASE